MEHPSCPRPPPPWLTGAFAVAMTIARPLRLGSPGIVPQIFTAAGNLGVENQSVVKSRAVGAGYLGLLVGPAVISWLSQVTGLTHALILPLVFCLNSILLAAQVASRHPGRTCDACTLAEASAQ